MQGPKIEQTETLPSNGEPGAEVQNEPPHGTRNAKKQNTHVCSEIYVCIYAGIYIRIIHTRHNVYMYIRTHHLQISPGTLIFFQQSIVYRPLLYEVEHLRAAK